MQRRIEQVGRHHGSGQDKCWPCIGWDNQESPNTKTLCSLSRPWLAQNPDQCCVEGKSGMGEIYPCQSAPERYWYRIANLVGWDSGHGSTRFDSKAFSGFGIPLHIIELFQLRESVRKEVGWVGNTETIIHMHVTTKKIGANVFGVETIFQLSGMETDGSKTCCVSTIVLPVSLFDIIERLI